MNIKQKREGETLTVYIEGMVDTTTAPTLLEVLQQAIPGISNLILDFEKVDYVSSAALRVLLCAEKAIDNHGKMVLRNVNEDIMEVLELTGFTEFLTIE